MDPRREVPVIPAGQEPLIRAMLSTDLPAGWTFLGAEVTDREIRARYRRGRSEEAALRLTRREGSPSGVATARFELRFFASRGSEELRRLCARLAASVRAHEGAFRWVDATPSAPSPAPTPRAGDPAWGELPSALSAFLAPLAPALNDTLATDLRAPATRPAVWTLRRALRAVRRGDRRAAHRALAAASARAPNSLVTALVGAAAHTLLREPARAVGVLDRFMAQAPSAAHARAALAMRFETQRRMGWYCEARGTLAALRAVTPDELAPLLADAALYPARDDLDAAAPLDLDAARARFEAVLAAHPDDVAARVGLGSLRAWRGDVEGARAAAEGALRIDPSHGPAHRLRGAARMLAGAPEEALVDFEAAARLDPRDAEAAVWQADALMRLARYDDALRALERGCNLSPDGSNYVAAQVVKSLVLRAQGQRYWTPDEVVRANLLALAGPCDDDLDDLALLQRAHAALRGNRGWTPTRVDDDGALRTVGPALGPRIHAKRALLRFALTADLDAALDEFARLKAAWPRAAEPLNYEGELHLHRGDYEAARRCFEEARTRYARSRWAFIGLLAVAVLQGRFEDGLAIIREGVAASGPEGPTAFVYRGEALRRLGRLAEARADLTHAVTTTPSRVGAWANLGLLQASEGDVAGLAATLTALCARAHGLLSDAADALGLDLDDALQPARAVTVLEQALAMLRGNRASSCVTYFTPEGALRTVMTDAALPDEAGLLRRLLAAVR